MLASLPATVPPLAFQLAKVQKTRFSLVVVPVE
jgi:hypothetical protein